MISSLMIVMSPGQGQTAGLHLSIVLTTDFQKKNEKSSLISHLHQEDRNLADLIYQLVKKDYRHCNNNNNQR